MQKKSCSETHGTPSCEAWCDEDFLQYHCPDCQCAGCAFCSANLGSCEPLPDSDDTNVQQCQDFCEEENKQQHCLRCGCQSCSFCPGKDKLAERDVGCTTGQCSEFCDPLFKQQHCGLCDCKSCDFCKEDTSCTPANAQDTNQRQCFPWCDPSHEAIHCSHCGHV